MGFIKITFHLFLLLILYPSQVTFLSFLTLFCNCGTLLYLVNCGTFLSFIFVIFNKKVYNFLGCVILRGLGTLRQALRFPPKRHGTAPAPYRTSHFPVSRSHDQPKWSRKTQRDGAKPIPDLALSRQIMVSFFTFFSFLFFEHLCLVSGSRFVDF